MKKLLLLFSLTLVTAASFGQWELEGNYDLTFEDTSRLNHLLFDITSNPNNIWQIGAPQKTIFTGAYSAPNVIVTDTVNPYPANDTSIFTIMNVTLGGGFVAPHTVVLGGEYYVNSDTITDFGKIEFSPDNGINWVDLLTDTIYASLYYWNTPKPTLTGNSNGWQNFFVNIAGLGPVFNIQNGDTVLYRFTFISDSIQTNKDGLMFDNLHYEDYFEGIEEIQNDNLISISPNPASDELRIYSSNMKDNSRIQILSYTGQLLYENVNFTEESIDIRHLINGIYLLKYSDSKYFSVKRFVVQH